MRKSSMTRRYLLLWTFFCSLAACAGDVALNGIVVTPANQSVPDGTTVQYNALGYYNNGTTSDITTQVTWSSSDTTVAIIDSHGLATTVGPGTTTIQATSSTPSSYSATGSTGSTLLNVYSATLSSIAVTPANPSIPVGVTRQFTATGTYSDGSTSNISTLVAWTSSNTAVATVSSTGLATVVGPGSATINASSGSTTGGTTLTASSATLSSISVAPANPSIPAGVTRQFTATGTYSDGSSFDITGLVAWTSSNPSATTISSAGLVTTLAPGNSTITAASGGISGGTTLTVNSATLSSISVAPPNPSIPQGISQQFSATGIFSDGSSFDITSLAAWSSSTSGIATVSSTGLATGLARGTVTISAVSAGVSGSATLTVNSAILSSITVTPTFPLTLVGVNLQMKATGIYSDGTSFDITTLCAWTSQYTNVATVVGTTGVVSSVGVGSTTIRAAAGLAVGTTILTVNPG